MRSTLVRLVQASPFVRRVVKSVANIVDPMLPAEMRGERYFFHRLKARGFLDGLSGKRILEIGPKHGEDSRLLATLAPKELVLLDLPSKDATNREWLSDVQRVTSARLVQANLLYLTPD